MTSKLKFLHGKSLLKLFHLGRVSVHALTWKATKSEQVCLKTSVCLHLPQLIANPPWAEVSAAGRFLFFPKSVSFSTWNSVHSPCFEAYSWWDITQWNFSLGHQLPSSNVLYEYSLWFPSPIIYTGVLVLAGVELVFFIVSRMGLCIGFVLITVLIIHRCF